MSKTALFIKHQALPGKRDEVKRVWEKYVKPRSEANPAHEVYYYCYDERDTNTILVFQIYSDRAAQERFLQGDWYPAYLKEIEPLVAYPPEIRIATPVWTKPT